jgi:hypothetical protein
MKHDISNSADQDNSNGFFASIAYRADLQAQSVDLSPFIRYDPLLLPITTLAFVQISQRSTLRLEMGMTLLSPLALSTRLIKLLV